MEEGRTDPWEDKEEEEEEEGDTNHDVTSGLSFTYSPILHGPKWYPTKVKASFQ